MQLDAAMMFPPALMDPVSGQGRVPPYQVLGFSVNPMFALPNYSISLTLRPTRIKTDLHVHGEIPGMVLQHGSPSERLAYVRELVAVELQAFNWSLVTLPKSMFKTLTPDQLLDAKARHMLTSQHHGLLSDGALAIGVPRYRVTEAVVFMEVPKHAQYQLNVRFWPLFDDMCAFLDLGATYRVPLARVLALEPDQVYAWLQGKLRRDLRRLLD